MSNQLIKIAKPSAVSEVQRQAVIAFCQELLAEPTATEAAAAALDAVSRPAEVVSSPTIPRLLSTTRRMVAVSLPEIGDAERRRAAVAASATGDEQSTCGETAVMLAARSNGVIEPRALTALERHMAACRACRALRAHYQAADEDLAAAFVDRVPEPAAVPALDVDAGERPAPQTEPVTQHSIAERWLLDEPWSVSELQPERQAEGIPRMELESGAEPGVPIGD
jgi:hypothetical protein